MNTGIAVKFQIIVQMTFYRNKMRIGNADLYILVSIEMSTNQKKAKLRIINT